MSKKSDSVSALGALGNAVFERVDFMRVGVGMKTRGLGFGRGLEVCRGLGDAAWVSILTARPQAMARLRWEIGGLNPRPAANPP